MAERLSPEELELLGRCPLLRDGDEDLIRAVVAEPQAALEDFEAGQILYHPDHFRRCLGILLSGQVQVTNGGLSVSVLGPGELFGAAALYNDEARYAATLTARTPVRALLLPQELVDSLLELRPLIRRNYLRYLSGRIRFLSGRLQSLAQPGAEGKLARYLMASAGQGPLCCPATDLAKRLGVSRATLYRAFEALEGSGLIRREGKLIYVPDPAALESAL